MKHVILALALILAPIAAAAATVSALTPAAGTTAGGEYVHIRGSALDAVALVTFGGDPAAIAERNGTELVVVAPPHAAGRVDVALIVPVAPSQVVAGVYTYEQSGAGDLVRVLLPIAASAPGALQSNWVTELFAFNGNAEPAVIAGTTIAPFTTAALTVTPDAGSSGAFVAIPRPLAESVTIHARVHDTTRDADGWGAEIPAVPDSQFRRTAVLLGIPNDSRYRTLLRVYAYDGGDGEATLVLRDDTTGAALDTRVLILPNGYAQIPLDAPAGHVRLRAEVTSTSFLPLWAFVSITNNLTQQVTISTPSVSTTAMASLATPPSLQAGHWGGNGLCADVTALQVAITTNCAGGTFAMPVIGPDGHFEADGTYAVSVGPVRIVVQPPAHFSGVVQGDTMTLTIRTPTLTIGPVSTQFGSTASCPGSCP